MPWIDALALDELNAKGKSLVRIDGRQLLVVKTPDGIVAFPNRCPHEGYPLSEGDLCGGTLRCNWHNWTFDLRSGEAIVGGDGLEMTPVRIEGDRVLLSLEPRDVAAARARALSGLREALAETDQQHIVRETARLMCMEADPLDAVRTAFIWSASRFDGGTTHAVAGAPDWLTLFDRSDATPEQRLAALGEILGHIADDGRREPRMAWSEECLPWRESAFLEAVERQDEVAATARVRGALLAGIDRHALQASFAKAALTHYAGFGHSCIYTMKTFELVERLDDPAVTQALLLLLTRWLILAAREDLIPEFRTYATCLERWGIAPALHASDATDLNAPLGASPKSAMETVTRWSLSHPPDVIFRRLVEVAAWAQLHVDTAAFTTLDAKLGENVGWLDFTHALTFAESGELLAKQQPALWPAVLLQIACFIGRNAPFVDATSALAPMPAGEARAFFADPFPLLDHGRDRFIISVHLLKTYFAARRLAERGQGDPSLLAAAVQRFWAAPIKGRHVLRTARQMLELVRTQ